MARLLAERFAAWGCTPHPLVSTAARALQALVLERADIRKTH